MPYSYDLYLGIFYMHYHIDMITHVTVFGEPVGSTGGDKLITFQQNSTFLKQMDLSGLEPGWSI